MSQEFLRDRGGTGFWHETYSGEAALGAMFSARKRAGAAGEAKGLAAVTEDEFYSR